MPPWTSPFPAAPAPARWGVVVPSASPSAAKPWRPRPDEGPPRPARTRWAWTPSGPDAVGLDLAGPVGEHETPGDAVRAPTAVAPEAVACAGTCGGFAGNGRPGT